MKKPFKTHLILLNREPHVDDIVKHPGNNEYEFISNAEHLKIRDNCKPHQLVVVSDEIASLDTKYDGNDWLFIPENGMDGVVVPPGVLIKTLGTYYKIFGIYPNFNISNTISKYFVKQYLNAECPSEINVNYIKEVDNHLNLTGNEFLDLDSHGCINCSLIEKVEAATLGFCGVFGNSSVKKMSNLKLKKNLN